VQGAQTSRRGDHFAPLQIKGKRVPPRVRLTPAHVRMFRLERGEAAVEPVPDLVISELNSAKSRLAFNTKTRGVGGANFGWILPTRSMPLPLVNRFSIEISFRNNLGRIAFAKSVCINRTDPGSTSTSASSPNGTCISREVSGNFDRRVEITIQLAPTLYLFDCSPSRRFILRAAIPATSGGHVPTRLLSSALGHRSRKRPGCKAFLQSTQPLVKWNLYGVV